jgi:hypothetical protein
MSFKGDVALPNNTHIYSENPTGTIIIGKPGQQIVFQGQTSSSGGNNNLTVTGTSVLKGVVTAMSSLNIDGALNAKSNSNFNMDLNVTGTVNCNRLVQTGKNNVASWIYTGSTLTDFTLGSANAQVPSDAKLMQVTVIGGGGGGGAGGATVPAGNTIMGQWVQFDLGYARSLGSYYLQNYNPSGMTAWIIAGSNDTSNWQIIDQVSGASIYGGYSRSVPSPNNSKTYRYMRWICLATADRNYIFNHIAVWRDINGNTLSSVSTIKSSAPGDILPSDNSATITIDGSAINWAHTGNYSSGTYSGTSSTNMLDLTTVLGGCGGGGGSGSIVQLPLIPINPSQPWLFRMKAGLGGNGGTSGGNGANGGESIFSFFQSNANSNLLNGKITVAGGEGGKGGLTNSGAGHGGAGGGAGNGGSNGTYSASAINYGGGGASYNDGSVHNGNGGAGYVNGSNGADGSGGGVGGDCGLSTIGSQSGVAGGGGGVGGGNGASNGPYYFSVAGNGLDTSGAGGGGGSGYLTYAPGGKGGNGAVIINFIC